MSVRRRRREARSRFLRKLRNQVGTGQAAEAKFDRLARFLSDWCQVWDLCHRADCRRARMCRDPHLPCYDTQDDVIFTLLNEAPCMRAFHEAMLAADEEELAYE